MSFSKEQISWQAVCHFKDECMKWKGRRNLKMTWNIHEIKYETRCTHIFCMWNLPCFVRSKRHTWTAFFDISSRMYAIIRKVYFLKIGIFTCKTWMFSQAWPWQHVRNFITGNTGEDTQILSHATLKLVYHAIFFPMSPRSCNISIEPIKKILSRGQKVGGDKT